MASDTATGEWTYTLDNTLAATQGLTRATAITDSSTPSPSPTRTAPPTPRPSPSPSPAPTTPRHHLDHRRRGRRRITETGLAADDTTAVTDRRAPTGSLTATDVDTGETATLACEHCGPATYGNDRQRLGHRRVDLHVDNALAATPGRSPRATAITDSSTPSPSPTRTAPPTPRPSPSPSPAPTTPRSSPSTSGAAVEGAVTETGLAADDTDSRDRTGERDRHADGHRTSTPARRRPGVRAVRRGHLRHVAIDPATGELDLHARQRRCRRAGARRGHSGHRSSTPSPSPTRTAPPTPRPSPSPSPAPTTRRSSPRHRRGSKAQSPRPAWRPTSPAAVTAACHRHADGHRRRHRRHPDAGVRASAPATYGTIAIDPATGEWTYTLDNSWRRRRTSTRATASPQLYTVTVTDEHGAHRHPDRHHHHHRHQRRAGHHLDQPAPRLTAQ